MLKPKKGFVQAQLDIELLTTIQWGGIMRAMDAYAQHYHEEQVKKLKIPAVSVNNGDEFLSVRMEACPHFAKCINKGKNEYCDLKTFQEIDCFIGQTER